MLGRGSDWKGVGIWGWFKRKRAPGKHKSFKSAFWGSLRRKKRRNKTNAKNSPFTSTCLLKISIAVHAHTHTGVRLPGSDDAVVSGHAEREAVAVGLGRQARCSARKSRCRVCIMTCGCAHIQSQHLSSSRFPSTGFNVGWLMCSSQLSSRPVNLSFPGARRPAKPQMSSSQPPRQSDGGGGEVGSRECYYYKRLPLA